MNRFYELDPTIIGAEALSRCVKVLCDKDPSVMGASLILIENVVNADPSKYKHLTETLVGILGQIVGQVLGQSTRTTASRRRGFSSSCCGCWHGSERTPRRAASSTRSCVRP